MLRSLIVCAAGALFSACGSSLEPPTVQLPASELVASISEGERVDLDQVLDDEAWTLLELGADW